MRSKLTVPVAAMLALLVFVLPAQARLAPVSGRLSKSGFTVIALGYGGRATTVRPGTRPFKLIPPERKFTLQLRGRNGRYAGPVVVASSGSRAFETLKAGARLGTIKVLAGYAKLLKSPPAKLVVRRQWVRTKHRAPLGNGRNFGLTHRYRSTGSSLPGADSDRDGAPNAFDVDANGDGILDPLAPSGGAAPVARISTVEPPPSSGEAGVSPSPDEPGGRFMSQIFLDLSETLNVDAAAVTPQQIDAMLADKLNVKLLNVPQGELVELDCTGLVYCSPGGTGVAARPPEEGGPLGPFPGCCDPDGNGFGNLRGAGAVPLKSVPGGQGEEFSLDPNTDAEHIGSGDTIVERITKGGALTQTPVTIDFVFNTVPALASYDDGAGHSGTISYPTSAEGVGTQPNPIPVSAGESGDVSLAMRFWRPQRRGIAGAGEPAFMDIGHLTYSLDIVGALPPPPPGANVAPQCSAESITTSDPNLTLLTMPGPTPGAPADGLLADGAGDAAPDPANTLSFSVDLTKCMQAKGAAEFPLGTEIPVEIEARAQSSSDHANQVIWVKRVS